MNYNYKCPLEEQAEELELKNDLLKQMYIAIALDDYYKFLLLSNEFVYYWGYEDIFDNLFEELDEESLDYLEMNRNVLRYRFEIERGK